MSDLDRILRNYGLTPKGGSNPSGNASALNDWRNFVKDVNKTFPMKIFMGNNKKEIQSKLYTLAKFGGKNNVIKFLNELDCDRIKKKVTKNKINYGEYIYSLINQEIIPLIPLDNVYELDKELIKKNKRFLKNKEKKVKGSGHYYY